jgi:hypothetical protein
MNPDIGSNEPLRKRIVINLDSPPGAGPVARSAPANRGQRRWPKIIAIFLLLVLGVMVATGVGGYFWFRHYQTTPAYSLAVVFDAAQRNDMTTLDQHVDSDQIASNMIALVREKAAGRYGAMLSGPLQKQIDSLLPTFLPGLKQTVHEELVKQIQELSPNATARPVLLVALTVSSLAKIATEGDNANVTATVRDRTVALTMHRAGERWKVTDVKDDALVQRVVDDMMKQLPPIGTDLKLLNMLRAPATRKPRRR